MPKRPPRGFTLVELAIVMTIIGLLIGGILKGQQMIMNARITATIKEVQSLRAAVHAFRDKYAQIPGDMVTASQRVPGCQPGNVNFCANGNGNGRIGGLPTLGFNSMAHKDQSSTMDMPDFETTLFYKHMALADLITGVKPGADPVNDVATGSTHPKASIGGAFTVLYSGQGKRWVKGHVLRMQMGASGAQKAVGQDLLEGRYAWTIDRKMDDGKPKSGFVAGTYWGLGSGNADDYMVPPHDHRKDWILYFGLDGQNQAK